MIRALLLVALFAAQAAAEERPHPSVVRVGRMTSSTTANAGVGTLIAKDDHSGLVVTVAHVVEGSGRCYVDWGHSQPNATLDNHPTATVYAQDVDLDLALLLTGPVPAGIPVIPMATANNLPPIGDTVEFIGAGGGRWRRDAVVLRDYTPYSAVRNGQVFQSKTNTKMVLAYAPISGDSGGPVISNNVLVGVGSGGPGSPAYRTDASHAGMIWQLLNRKRSLQPGITR